MVDWPWLNSDVAVVAWVSAVQGEEIAGSDWLVTELDSDTAVTSCVVIAAVVRVVAGSDGCRVVGEVGSVVDDSSQLSISIGTSLVQMESDSAVDPATIVEASGAEIPMHAS